MAGALTGGPTLSRIAAMHLAALLALLAEQDEISPPAKGTR
jgi:hypothetical protein